MELEEGIDWINRCLEIKSGKVLTETEKALFTAGWLDYKYSKAGSIFGFNHEYLQKIGAVLWRNLSFTLETKVTKKTVRSVVEKLASQSDQSLTVTHNEGPQESSPFVLGRRPPMVNEYFGYEPELMYLKQCVLEAQCVILFGQAGIGKSLLASRLIGLLKPSTDSRFELVIWQSIYVHPNLDSLLAEIFMCLELEPYDSSQDCSLRIRELIEILKQRRCLIVLDGAEEILKGNSQTSLYGENEPYRSFFQEIIGRNHSSCVLLTTREPFRDLSLAKEMGQAVRVIELSGLGQHASALLESQGLVNQDDAFGYLIHKYRGNPLSLKLVSHQIKRFFGSNVQSFLDCDTTWLGEPLQEALKVQFKRGHWSELQRNLMYHLACSTHQQESKSVYEVFSALNSEDSPVSMSEFIVAMDTLCDRCLLESSEENGEVRLSIQPVIKKFLLSYLDGVIPETLAA